MQWLFLPLVILLANELKVLKDPSTGLLPQILLSSIVTKYSKTHLPLIDSKMFFHPAAVSDTIPRDISEQTVRSSLFHVHVSVTTVGSFIMNLINVHTKWFTST